MGLQKNRNIGEKETRLPKEVPEYPNKGENSSNFFCIYGLGMYIQTAGD